MSSKCPKCGAEFPLEEQCRERFERCLAKDYEEPSTYGTVHHLTVACYMLQHNAYSREGWLEARKMVAQAIEQGITPTALRKQNRRRFDSAHRQWRLLRGAKLPEVDTIAWTRTIADVRLDTAEVYCADVELWAASVLADTQSWIKKLKHAS